MTNSASTKNDAAPKGSVGASASHTPGPWRVFQSVTLPGHHPYEIYSPEQYIGTVASEIEEGPTARDTANARLIAAAPELLAACKAAWDADDMAFGSLPTSVANRLLLAIKKAEGQ